MSNRLGGIVPALVSPMDANGDLNLPVLERLLERVYQANVDGVYLCGSTGEGMVLSASERKTVAEAVMRCSPRGKQVIVHVGAWSFAESRDLAIHAERIGAAALSALPPAGANFAEVLQYYRGLASCTGLPFLAYYFPAFSGMPLSLQQLREVCALPGIAGLKFTDYDLFTLSTLVREGKVIFNGRDEVLSAGLLLGAQGGIGSIYNVVPDWFTHLYSAAAKSDWKTARTEQDRINDLIGILVQYPFLSALKRVLTWQGFSCGEPREPRSRLTEDQTRRLRDAIEPVLFG